MELYLFNIDMYARGQFQLVLEGDDTGADDGDWKAIGGGASLLGQLKGYWQFITPTRPEVPATIDLMQGTLPNRVSALWRNDYHLLGLLFLPNELPYLGGGVYLLNTGHSGEGSLINRDSAHDWEMDWRVARRFF